MGTDDTMTPRTALTSWQTMDSFDVFGHARITMFAGFVDCDYDCESMCS